MGAGPLLDFVAVETRADEVDEEDEAEGCEDGAFDLEVGPGVSLVDIVPLCVGRVSLCWGEATEGVGDGGDGSRSGFGALCEVAEVWLRERVSECLGHGCIKFGDGLKRGRIPMAWWE